MDLSIIPLLTVSSVCPDSPPSTPNPITDLLLGMRSLQPALARQILSSLLLQIPAKLPEASLQTHSCFENQEVLEQFLFESVEKKKKTPTLPTLSPLPTPPMDSDSSSMLFDLDQSDADLWLEMSPDAFERDMTTFEYLCTEASFMAASSSSISHGLNSAILSPLVQNVPLAPLASPSPASCVLNPLLLSPLPSATTANHQQQHMMLSSNTYSRNGFLAPPSWTSPPPGPSSTRLYPASVIPQPQPHENLSADYRISSPILISPPVSSSTSPSTSVPTATHQQQQQQNPLLSRTSNNIITDSRSRQHQCGTCGKLCLRKQDLKRHEATHATSKDFWCPHGCGSAFARNDALGRHVKTGRCLQKVAKRMGSVGSSGGGVSAERNDSS